jgi:hypothetical protein
MEEMSFHYPLRRSTEADQSVEFEEFSISQKDKKILRELAEKKAEIAKMDSHQEKISMWKRLNSLQDIRPLIFINEIPWNEMDFEGELTLETSTDFSRFLELRLRRVLYSWKHMPADMVVEDTMICYMYIENSGFGIEEDVVIAETDKTSAVYSRKFTPQFETDKDINKIKTPKITHNIKKTKKMYESMADVFDGILDVEKKGIPGFIFNPWDELIKWYGVQKAMEDLVLKPDYIHKIMRRLTDALLAMVDQHEKLGALALNNGNYRIVTGGLGYSDELPQKDYDPDHIRPIDMWGGGMAQIFSDISPDMHHEFALQYENELMEKFGLNYYGCCEPLDKKIDILRKIPRLRKISMSPWVDLESAAEKMGKDFVFSYKPIPSIFAGGSWDPKAVKKQLKDDMGILKNCVVEIIMKDISTVKYKPQRLWDWARIAVEAAEEN